MELRQVKQSQFIHLNYLILKPKLITFINANKKQMLQLGQRVALPSMTLRPKKNSKKTFILFVCIVLDIVISFRTTYVHIGGEVVSDSKRIRNNYIKGWFALDLISSVPLEMIDMIIEQIDTNEKAVCTTTGNVDFV